MEELYKKLTDKVNPKYYGRLKEISRALSPKEDFDVCLCNNEAVLRGKVLKSTKDSQGYRHIDHEIIPLSDNVQFTPHFKVEGDFAVVKVSSRRIDPVNRRIVRDTTIFIFEKKEDKAELLRGLIV